MTLTLNEYQRRAKRTRRDDQNQNEALANAALGIAGEAGEVADTVKKALYQHHIIDRQQALEELGDVLWYISWLADLYGYTLEDVAHANILKLWTRYPNGFNAERSRNRANYKEKL